MSGKYAEAKHQDVIDHWRTGQFKDTSALARAIGWAPRRVYGVLDKAGALRSRVTAKGEWLGPGIFRCDNGRVCATDEWLAAHRLKPDGTPAVPKKRWETWKRQPSPAGQLDWFIVERKEEDNSKGRRFRTVFAFDHADAICRRRGWTGDDSGEGGDPRVSVPGGYGEWLSDDLFQDNEYGPCVTDPEFFHRWPDQVSRSFPSRYRGMPHPALDPNVNGGKLRARRPPRRAWSPSTGQKEITVVTCLEDLKTVMSWRGRKKSTADDAQPAGQLTSLEIADKLEISRGDGRRRRALGLALGLFAAEHPANAHSIHRWRTDRNGPQTSTRYDWRVLEHWLRSKGKTTDEAIRNLAAKARHTRPARGKTWERRLRRAIALLRFALTIRPKGTGSRNLRQFISHPPYDLPLQPIPDGLDFREVRRLAKGAGLGKNCLYEAAKSVGVRFVPHGRLGTRWVLDKPVLIQRPAPAEATHRLSSEDGSPAKPSAKMSKNKGGRPIDEKTAAVYEFCHDEYQSAGAPTVVIRCNRKFGAGTVKDDTSVRRNVSRFKKNPAGYREAAKMYWISRKEMGASKPQP